MPKYSGFDPIESHNVVTTSSSTGSSNYDSDPVSLYLPFDSDVQDASANNHTVTAYGVTISSAQSKFGGYSALFDGSNDYLSIPSDSSLVFGDEDFTIEFFIYTNDDTQQSPFTHRDGSAGVGDWTMNINRTAAGHIEFYNGGYSINAPVIQTTISGGFSGGWHHIAVTRSGDIHRLFFDGVLKASVTNSTTYSSGPTELHIGRDNFVGGRNYLDGYLDDFRIIKGVARYTKNFIPPSQAVGATLNGANETNTTTDFTTLYLPFDSDIQDDSAKGHSMTATGDAAISSTQSKFGGYSLATDGTGDRLEFTYDTNSYFGTGDFTVEAWVWITGYSGGYYTVVSLGQPGATGSYQPKFLLNVQNSGGRVRSIVGGTYIDHSGAISGSFPTGEWVHLAATRHNGTYKTFINGVLNGSTSNSTDVTSDSGTSTIAGASYGGGSGTAYSNNGYIDDLRILKGYAKYTTDFVPPSSAVGTSVSETVNDLTVLYLPFDDDSFEDQARNHSVTKNGNVALNTSVKKFGTSSAYFSGSSDNLVLPVDDFSFGDNDFTIEAWVYLTSYDGQGSTIISRWNGNETNGKGWLLYILGGGQLNFTYSTDGSSNVSTTASGGNLSLNTWTHVAFTRQGDVGRFFINGTVDSTTRNFSGSSIYNPPTSSVDVMIGAREGGVVSKLSGYIDDLRVIKGKAKYTASFTAPTSAVGTELLETTTTVTTDTKTLSSTWTMTDDGSSPRSFVDMRLDNTWANNEHLQSQSDHRWYNPPGAPGTTATGGSIATPGNGYRYHVFTSPGTFQLSAIDGSSPSLAVEYLVVAGGGGGAANRGGGAGAGGFRTNEDGNPKAGAAMNIATGSFPIVVGTGGAGGVWPGPIAYGTKGGASSFNGIQSAGGGGGGGPSGPGAEGQGGSGGGAFSVTGPSGFSGNTPPTTPPQGNPGGSGSHANYAGGGGGAGAAASTLHAGDGHAVPSFSGPILAPVIPGAMATAIGPTGIYAGGGGGGAGEGTPSGAGNAGTGGGGAGGARSIPPGSFNPNSGEYGPAGAPGVDGTGGGGGGAGNFPGTNPNMRPGGDGGNGVVIIKYAY